MVCSKNIHLLSEGSWDVLRFSSVSNLLTTRNDVRLAMIVSSVSCLTTIADLNSETEASQLIDFMTKLRMVQINLTIVNPRLKLKSIQNKTLNFNVMMHHHEPGANTTGCPEVNVSILIFDLSAICHCMRLSS